MIGRDILVGADPAVVAMSIAGVLIAVLGGMWAIAWWLLKRFGLAESE